MNYKGTFIEFNAKTEGRKENEGPHASNVRIELTSLGGACMESYQNDAECKIILNFAGEYEYDDLIEGLEKIVKYLKEKR